MIKVCRLLVLVVVGAFQISASLAGQSSQAGANLDQDWRLWLDKSAAWKDDTLYLPDEVDLTKLPVNPPTGGWSVLTGNAGIPVSLPGTVEEHYWAEFAGSGTPESIVNGQHAYFGVSWWYRNFTPPALKPGERLILRFPSARLRSEVYVNGKLVAYNIITELPFTADVTDALLPGKPNQLAVRITNPGGDFGWGDTSPFPWGKYLVPTSHGFGGMAGGVTMSVRGAVAVTELAVLNTPQLGTVNILATVNSTGRAYDGPINFTIHGAQGEVWNGSSTIHVDGNGTAEIQTTGVVKNPDLWDIGHPNLYEATATLSSITDSEHTTEFGIRFLTATGIGSDAKLEFNGRRVVIRSSISWGFWAPNGIFPDKAAVQREIDAVHAIGLNCIQNHRHMPKEIVLNGYDHAGLFRYCEAGGGCLTFADAAHSVGSTQPPIDTSGKGGEATTFTEKYERAKVLGMVKAFRSHPSVPLWVVQNEVQPDLHNPKIFQVMREMHALDPSRLLVLKSGVSVNNQVWVLPYSDDFMTDDGKAVSGWADNHTAGSSPGVYVDSMYKGATDYLYNGKWIKEIGMWGEMATSASPDNHEAITKWYHDHDITGYDRAAHEAISGTYNKFLADYHFQDDFPTASSVFAGAAAKHYFAAARLMENGRISNANDYLVLSGWESTILDNHSGMVDDLRMPKGDPQIIQEANAPKMLVVRPLHLVVAKGDSAVVDVHLVNEENLNGSYTLSVSAIGADGKSCFQSSFPVTVIGGDTFAQLLQDKISFAATTPGMTTVTASLLANSGSKPVLTRSAQVLVVDTAPSPLKKSIAFSGDPRVGEALKRDFGVDAVPLANAPDVVDEILVTAKTPHWGKDDSIGITEADDLGLYHPQSSGQAGLAVNYSGFAPGALKVELYCGEPNYNKPGERVFDVALNDEVVLKDFDMVADSGRGKGIVKTFNITSKDGTFRLTVPRSTPNRAMLAALRITDSRGKVVRGVFREHPYKDPTGAEWRPIVIDDMENAEAKIPSLLDRARQGSRVILLTSGSATVNVAKALADAKVLTFSGMVGPSTAPWMGFWYFGRKHWLLDGLPSGCVLDWPYQITDDAGTLSDGMIIQAPNLDAVIGYGRDHNVKVGLGAAVIPVGKGSVVFCCLPGLADSFASGTARGFDPVSAQRIIYNALK